MLNRKARRAAASAQRAARKARQAPPEQAVSAAQMIYQDYVNAVGFQKLVTELYDHTQESLRWAEEDASRADIESDAKMLKAMGLEARHYTLECGLAFLEVRDPRPVRAEQLEPAEVA